MKDKKILKLTLNKLIKISTKRPQRFFKADLYKRVLRILISFASFRDLKKSAKPRLFFDLSILSVYDNQTGVQRVVRSVFNELKTLVREDYDLIPVSMTPFSKRIQVLKERKVTGKTSFRLTFFNIAPRKGDVFISMEQAFLEHIAHVEDFREMRQQGCRVFLTVYDLLPIQLPKFFPSESEEILTEWLCATSDFVDYVCDSQTVESDLRQFLLHNHLKLNRCFNFRPGFNFIKEVSSTGLTPLQEGFLKKMGDFNFNFLMVGTIEPRKGHSTVLSLFEKLWQTEKKNISLTFIGRQGWMVDDLINRLNSHPKKDKNFYWFNDASDEFLDACYKKTDAVIIASMNEGFGLPLLEAASRKCRILANDIQIFREVAPEKTCFINFSNFESALGQLKNWLEHPGEYCSVDSFHSWKESTEEILAKGKILTRKHPS